MKKLLLLCITLIVIVTSCSPDEDDNHVQFHLEFVEVIDNDLPEYFERGQEYTVTIQYIKPSDCHYFHGFYYEDQGETHVIAPQTMVIEDPGCEQFENLTTASAQFTFPCKNTYAYDYYIFKFYSGEDQLGNQNFNEVIVPIIN